MKKSGWISLCAFALALFFIMGAIGNIAALGTVEEDYARWGYPTGFHYLTGALELIAAVLLARRGTRLPGVVLGLAIMGAAAATLLIHGEIAHAAAPITVFALLLGLGAGVAQDRRQ